MPTQLTFGNGDALIGSVDVWLREHWNSEWTLVPDLHCEQATWCASPNIPTATLSWIYGRLSRENSFHWEDVLKLADKQRWFVKVRFYLRFDPAAEVGNQFRTRDWYGLLDVEEDYLGGSLLRRAADGSTSRLAIGEQKLVCYGLDRLLYDQVVDHSYWRGNAGEPSRIDRALTFNADGKPNRHANPLAGIYHFGVDRQAVKPWTSRQIVDYLLEYHTPRNLAGTKVVKFKVQSGGPAIIPSWDRPELPTLGVRTHELLDQILPRQRLLGWYCEVDEASNEVRVKPFTFTDADIGIVAENAQPIPANPRQFTLNFEDSPAVNAAVKLSTLDVCDQVLVRGARRRSCLNVSFPDHTLQRDWTPTEENWYRIAASADADYPAASEIKERQKRNQHARQAERVQRVYARFEISPDWDGKAGDGIGTTSAKKPAFPLVGNVDNAFPVYTLDMALLPTLPLLIGVDYAGNKVTNGAVDETTGTPARDEMPLLVAWQLPLAGKPSEQLRWINVERLGQLGHFEEEHQDENHRWSASVHVVPHSRALEIRVQGEPQHVIASGFDFTPQEEDEFLGGHDFRKMIVTVCVFDDRYCEARWPTPAVGAQDALRVMHIDAGEGYRQDYIVPQTIVAISSAGKLVRSDGGYLRDDASLLKAAAKVAFSWYGRERAVLEFGTSQLDERLFLGDLILEMGDPDVAGGHRRALRSVVTEVTINWPRSTDSSPPPPVMSWITQAGELDALRLIGPGGAVRGEAGVKLPQRPIKL